MFAKFVVREMSPIPMVSIRYTIVALTLFAMLAWRGEKLLPPRRTWPALFTMGILGVCINNVTQFTGLQYSTVTNFTIIATLTPIVTALLSFVLIHERLHSLQWLGICSSLCGALYLLSNGSLAAILTLSFNIGDVLFFTSQVAWALYSIIVVRIIDDVSPFAIVAWSGLLGSLTTAAGAAYFGHFELPSLLSPLALGSYLFVIFAGGLIAMIFWNKGTGIVGPSQAAVFMNIMPLVGIVCGILFLDEHFLAAQAVGGVLILSGVYLTTQYRTVAYRLAKYFTRRQRKRQPLR
ncbi:DMT family transporter [Phascolarctobacterium faecium]|uniref:DMT family transporter n=1 Tax=Phascolarctobacterium faecium TaxID=33025 RepID=UPI00242D7CCA|nr:DMT family transporter [Phascolarctobacterium faecium]